jgi:shikimate kinase
MILCGPPFSGKSYYGQRIAAFLNQPFIDTDLMIEKCYREQKGAQKTCREIFRDEGEAFFRELEHEVVKELRSHQKTVIAIGGGTLLQEANASILKQLGRLILLKTETSVLLSRLKQKPTLPAYLEDEEPEKKFIDMIEKRNAVYFMHADLSIETSGRSDEEVIHLICHMYNGVN